MITTTPHPGTPEPAARPAATAELPALRPARPAAPAAGGSATPLRATVTAAAAALAVGLAVGAATSFLQTWLPSPFTGLANAVAPWLMAPFLVGLRLARGWWGAALLGLLACVAQVPGYYLTADLRGFPVGTTFVLVWTVAAVVGGPVFGAVGLLQRTSVGRLAGLAPATVAAVWCAESIVLYGVLLGYYGEAAVHAVVGIALLVLLARRRRQLRPALVWSVPVLALGAVAFHALMTVTGSGLPIL